MPPPSLAVIVPHYNDVTRLMLCLERLMPQVDAGVEVVVADNGSTVSLDPVCSAHPGLKIVTEPAKGAAHARNQGVEVTTAPLLVFLDCDCVPAPGWLEAARTALQRSGADLVGGRIDVFDETPGPRNGAQAFEAVFAFDNRAYVERKGFSVTANLVTRREVFLATGSFIHGLSEDLDWCRRAVAKGFRLAYDDSLRVAHPSRGDWAALARKWRRLTEEGFAVHGLSLGRRFAWAGKALQMPVSVLAHAPRVMWHPALNGPGERIRALGTLARLRLLRMRWMLSQALRGQILMSFDN